MSSLEGFSKLKFIYGRAKFSEPDPNSQSFLRNKTLRVSQKNSITVTLEEVLIAIYTHACTFSGKVLSASKAK